MAIQVIYFRLGSKLVFVSSWSFNGNPLESRCASNMDFRSTAHVEAPLDAVLDLKDLCQGCDIAVVAVESMVVTRN